MTDENADRRVSIAVRYYGGRNFRTVVGIPNVESMVRAFARAGMLATPEGEPGHLRVCDAPTKAAALDEELDAIGTEAMRLLCRLSSGRFGADRLREAMGATPEEAAHLRMKRFDRLPIERIRAMRKGLRRLERETTASSLHRPFPRTD